MTELKQGLYLPLSVRMNISPDDVKRIDFVFCKTKGHSADKTAEYIPGGTSKGCELANQTDSSITIRIPFTPEETRCFTGRFYMDVKINRNSTPYNPVIKTTELYMHDTLFDSSTDEVIR